MSPELREQLREAVACAYQHDCRDPWELLWPECLNWACDQILAIAAEQGVALSWIAVVGLIDGWRGITGDTLPVMTIRGLGDDGAASLEYLDAREFGEQLRAEHTARWTGITPLRSPSTGLPYDSLALMAEMEKR